MGVETVGDAWWDLREPGDVARIGLEVVGAIERNGLPRLQEMSSEHPLRDVWLAARVPGITELQLPQYLPVLLNEPELRAQQHVVLDELIGFGRRKGFMGEVGAHLEELGLE